MNIKITKELAAAIGWKKVAKFGLKKDEYHWDNTKLIYLPRYGVKTIENLIEWLKPLESIRGVKTQLRDCRMWLKALDGKGVKPRSVQQFESLLRHHLQQSGMNNKLEGRPIGPRLYKLDVKRDVWLSYYVSRTEYTPEDKRSGYWHPATATAYLIWTEFGGRKGEKITWLSEHCSGRTVEEALAAQGYVVETDELREEYLRRKKLFEAYAGDIGKQFLAIGVATDDCDGNREHRDDSWYWNSTKTITLEAGGEPSRVVCDVFYEEDRDHDRHSEAEKHIDRLWWYNAKSAQDFDSDDIDDLPEGFDNWDDVPEPEVPLHPMLACFDMRRHLRLRIDVGQLTEYVYDSRLADKLVLPVDSTNLVEMLLAHKSQFRDIVKGKSGGAIILCAGIPGTGKTLTAEVYAEVMARPLYTVQASQLGTDPDDLEEELLKTFARSGRWNAIMLLDEADVYVNKRGQDLTQNAIVGVFLRVLEYYKGVLFMTTNRSDLVDDAIASRCVARIDYNAPTLEDQRKIWKILADTAGIDISEEVINEVSERYPELTGRDVKNLLKLAKLVTDSRECEITVDIIRFVKRFKPTVSTSGEVEDEEPVTLPPMPSIEASETTTMEILSGNTGTVTPPNGEDWRRAVVGMFDDGAPHAVSEAKRIVKDVAPGVHPNAVTNALMQMVKSGKLSRLDSGLYRKED